MKGFITTTEKTNKKGFKYYTQEFIEMDFINGEFTENITWTGRCKKEDYDWCVMIAETQPERLIYKCENILSIKN